MRCPQALSADRQNQRWLVATPGPLTWAQVKQLNTHGLVAVSRHVLAHPPSQAERYPGFESGQDQQLGVAALVGGWRCWRSSCWPGRRSRWPPAAAAATWRWSLPPGAPAQLRRIVLADGVVLDGGGCLRRGAGDRRLRGHPPAARAPVQPPHRRLPGVSRSAGRPGRAGGDHRGAGRAGPAWIAARQDVVAALAGRRGITRSRRRWVVLGAVLLTTGALVAAAGARRADATIIVAGLVVVELGLCRARPRSWGWWPGWVASRRWHRGGRAARRRLQPHGRGTGDLGGDGRGRWQPRGRRGAARGDRARETTTGSWVGPGRVRAQAERTVPPDVAALHSTMPVQQIHRISQPSWRRWHRIVPRRAAGTSGPRLPYDLLGRDPTPAEQRAARRDSRCDGVGDRYQYFGGIGSTGGMTVIIDPAAVGAVANLAAEDADRAAAALRAGNVVVDDPRHLDSGRVTLASPRSRRPATRDDKDGHRPRRRAPASATGAHRHDDRADRPLARAGLGGVHRAGHHQPCAHRRRGGPPPGRARQPARQRARCTR